MAALSCSASSLPPAPAPSVSASAAEVPSSPPPQRPTPLAIPSSCAAPGDPKMCVFSREFAERLCGGSPNPDVALARFRKGTPWTRGYAAHPVQAWNASGGESASAMLASGEELLVVRMRGGDKSGMQINGSNGSFDALRWDGSCVSLSSDELTMRNPGIGKSASIPWRKLDEKTRDALLADKKVSEMFERRRKECNDATPQCEKAEAALSRAIVDFVRGGGAVPVTELP